MFIRIFRKPENLKKVLNVLLKKEIIDVKVNGAEEYEIETEDGKITNEATLKQAYAAKGIRFDILFEGEKEYIDLEMQSASESIEALAKRCSVYTANMVVESTDSGMRYRDKKDTYVIFLCAFDPFKKNAYLYKVRPICYYSEPDSDKSNVIKEYNSGDYTYFFNMCSTDKSMSNDLEDFFNFITNTTNYTNTEKTTELVKYLKAEVDKEKCSKSTKEVYNMCSIFIEDLKYDAMEEGRKEGIKEGQLKSLISLFKQGIITLEQAAKEANMPEDDFKSKASL